MIEITSTEIFGWEAAVRGMRNPMNSWDKSDSFICKEELELSTDELAKKCEKCAKSLVRCDIYDHEPHYVLGINDLSLMKKLVASGTDHRKFMRMRTVYADITAPLYWWKEYDTYKVGTVANSCSTMHKIHTKEFTLDDFSHEHLLDDWDDEHEDEHVCFDGEYFYTAKSVLENAIIPVLNQYRLKFLDTKDKKWWWQMIQLLPSSYNQKRTVMLNYEVLTNMYHSRKAHKLDEWINFCRWVETLPYAKELICNVS